MDEKEIELESATKESKTKIELSTKMAGMLPAEKIITNAERNKATNINQFIMKTENTTETLTNKNSNN